jgi:hypothetical protein
VNDLAVSAHMSSMTLRTEIEALLVEFEHFAYRGAPLDVAVEKLREILARTETRILTTLEELNSEEARTALCLIAPDGTGIVTVYDRCNGKNTWAGPGSDYFFSSEHLLAGVVEGYKPNFIVVDGPDVEAPAKAAPRVLTTVEELDSEETFKSLCLVPDDGHPVSPYSREDGVNSWAEFGTGYFKTSARVLAECTKEGIEPRFTLIERP